MIDSDTLDSQEKDRSGARIEPLLTIWDES